MEKRDDLDKFLKGWMELAVDRDEWKTKGEAFTQQWETS